MKVKIIRCSSNLKTEDFEKSINEFLSNANIRRVISISFAATSDPARDVLYPTAFITYEEVFKSADLDAVPAAPTLDYNILPYVSEPSTSEGESCFYARDEWN